MKQMDRYSSCHKKRHTNSLLLTDIKTGNHRRYL